MPSNYGLYKRYKIKMLALFVFEDNGAGRPNLEKLLNFFSQNLEMKNVNLNNANVMSST
jgi:hypothetical protein